MTSVTTRASIRGGGPDHATLYPGEHCHYLAPARLGRRRGDPVGHLELTNLRLRFRGSVDRGAAWHEVASVERVGEDMVVTLADRRRRLRFRCQHVIDASAAAGIAQGLVELARR